MKVRRRTALGRVASLLAFAAVTLLLGLGVAPVTVRADAAQEDGMGLRWESWTKSILCD